MASKGGKKVINKKMKFIIGGIVALLAIIVGVVIFLMNPSADSVFRAMNEEMLKVKSVTIDQQFNIKDADGQTSNINSKMFLNMASSKDLSATGDFDMSIVSDATPMTIAGDLIKISDSSYVKYSEFSSTSPSVAASFSAMESKLKNNWIKVRDDDNFVSFAQMPIQFATGVMPTPFANLDSAQRKEVLAILQDKKTYTIDESSRVDIGGVSAYKYQLTFNETQCKKAAKLIADYVSYFSTSDGETGLDSLTVWVNIATKQIIKIGFDGSGTTGSGTFTFSDYNQTKTIEKPAEYSIESELLN